MSPKAGVSRLRLRTWSSIGEVAAIHTPENRPYRQENTRNHTNSVHLEKRYLCTENCLMRQFRVLHKEEIITKIPPGVYARLVLHVPEII